MYAETWVRVNGVIGDALRSHTHKHHFAVRRYAMRSYFHAERTAFARISHIQFQTKRNNLFLVLNIFITIRNEDNLSELQNPTYGFGRGRRRRRRGPIVIICERNSLDIYCDFAKPHKNKSVIVQRNANCSVFLAKWTLLILWRSSSKRTLFARCLFFALPRSVDGLHLQTTKSLRRSLSVAQPEFDFRASRERKGGTNERRMALFWKQRLIQFQLTNVEIRRKLIKTSNH